MSTAALQFEQFVEDGHYGKMKNAEQFISDAKEELKSLLYAHEGKRFEFEKAGMVAKFVASEVREIDHENLIIDLSDYVLEDHLHNVLDVDTKKLTEEQKEDLTQFYLPETYYVRATLNKTGKTFRNSHDILFGGQSEIELISEIRDVQAEMKQKRREFEALKDMLKLDQHLIQNKKIKTSVGSISYLKNKREYNIEQILNEKSLDFFLKYGKVNLERLNEWIEMGVINGALLKRNRTVVDITLQFMVMTLEAENKAHQGMQWRKKQLRNQAV